MNGPIGSDQDRSDLLLLCLRRLDSCFAGKRSIWTKMEFICGLATWEPGRIWLSNRMEITSYLKADPVLWSRLLPYLRPDCPAVVNK